MKELFFFLLIALFTKNVVGLSVEKQGLVIITEFPQIFESPTFLSVHIKNLESIQKNISIYSYLHDGANSLSGSWKKNEQVFTINGFEQKNMVLKNELIKPVSGVFEYTVRLVVDGKKIDLNDGVFVNQTFKSLNKVSSVKSFEPMVLAIIGLISLYFGLKKL